MEQVLLWQFLLMMTEIFLFSEKYNLEKIEVIRANNEEYIFDGTKAF